MPAFRFTVLSIILKNNSPYELVNRKNMKDILEGLLPYSGKSELHVVWFPAKQTLNNCADIIMPYTDFLNTLVERRPSNAAVRKIRAVMTSLDGVSGK